MAALTPREQAIRDRVEALIRVMEPGLDLLLAAADRVSRLVERESTWTPPTGAGLPGADQRSRTPE
jgi:hypothetical protein